MLSAMGWLGNVLLALCGLPSAIISIKQGNSNHISGWLLVPWYLGELLVALQVTLLGQNSLQFNYFSNIVLLTIIVYYKLRPRK